MVCRHRLGRACLSLQEADDAIADIDGGVWVVKAQIHAGGRGKGGGVKVTKSAADANWRHKTYSA